MVRSMTSRGERLQAPTAPTRRQLQRDPSVVADLVSVVQSTSTRLAAQQRRRALTTSGKAAKLLQGSIGGGRIRTLQDKRRPDSRQLESVGRQKSSISPVPFNLSRSSLPITHQQHPLANSAANARLRSYEEEIKGRFDRIVPLLKTLSVLQHEPDFIEQAQRLSRTELGFDLPGHILEKAWVRPLDMRALFAWCVFESHRLFSDRFFQDDPLQGAAGSPAAVEFEQFLLDCGFHLLDITPCADGRLAHTVAYALRIPFSAVRRRSHAGAMFDVENTVNRWVKTEHRRHRESMPNPATDPTRYLKVVTYHFSSLDSEHQGCAAHGSNDVLAASAGHQRLLDFREAVENTFCCGASVDLLLIGLDTDTDAIRVHPPSSDSTINLDNWLCARELHAVTAGMTPDQAMAQIADAVEAGAPGSMDAGMVTFLTRLLANNFSQIDYVQELHGAPYPDAGHAERFIGVGIGFKEVHLRNLTYFAHLHTVEEGAPDLDVGVKIFRGLNVARDLPIPVVVRFDYSGRVPGARERAIADCRRVDQAIASRYGELLKDGFLHTCLTIRDRNQQAPAEVVASTLAPPIQEAH